MTTLKHLILVVGLALVAQPIVAEAAQRGGGGGAYPGAVSRGGGGGGGAYPGAMSRGGGAYGRYYRPPYGGRYPYNRGYYGRYPYSAVTVAATTGAIPTTASACPISVPTGAAIYPGYAYAPGVVYGYDEAPDETAVADSNVNRPPDADSSLVRFRIEVRPDDTSVYVNDEFQGLARETRVLYLPPGRHKIELLRPGFTTEVREVQAALGESQDVSVELQRP